MRQSGVGSGGGYGSRTIVKSAAPKTEPKARAINPKGVSQIGSSMGNKVMDRGKVVHGAIEPVRDGKGYAMPVGPSDNVKAVGVGGGRTVYHCGTQAQTGPAAGQPKPAGRDILSEFGPDKR